VSLQSKVLSHLLGEGMGELWAKVLVGRHYKLPENSRENPRKYDATYPKSVIYAVGQPMGALSS